MKKYWKEGVLIGIVTVVIIPLILAFMLSFQFIRTDTTNEWIGFWGGYLGAILGGLITLFVLFATLKDNRNLQKEQERIEFCRYIVELVSSFCGKINERNIYMLRFISQEEMVKGNLEDAYRALLAQNEAYIIVQTVSSHLIAKMGDKDYAGVESLMDNLEELKVVASSCDIKFSYTQEESRELEEKCDVIKTLLAKMGNSSIEFIKANTQ
mgnify:CR=1 FL=1